MKYEHAVVYGGVFYPTGAEVPTDTPTTTETTTETTETAAETGEMITAHLDADDLKEMKLTDLKSLADEMAINMTGLKTKDDYINAIVAEEVLIDKE